MVCGELGTNQLEESSAPVLCNVSQDLREMFLNLPDSHLLADSGGLGTPGC
jgi:hypothetical protein